MQTKTITIEMYDFDELSESAQDTALDNIRTINNEYYEWWLPTYEDAEMVGLCITSFGLDRQRGAEGTFKDGAESCAHLIVDNHGKTCETYLTATSYLKDRDNLINFAAKDEDGNFENEYELDGQLDDLDTDFKQSLLEDYSMSLQREYEYIDSKDNLLGVIACNDYTFTSTGQIA